MNFGRYSNIFYFDYSEGYRDVCICQKYKYVHIKLINFVLYKLFVKNGNILNKWLYSLSFYNVFIDSGRKGEGMRDRNIDYERK